MAFRNTNSQVVIERAIDRMMSDPASAFKTASGCCSPPRHVANQETKQKEQQATNPNLHHTGEGYGQISTGPFDAEQAHDYADQGVLTGPRVNITDVPVPTDTATVATGEHIYTSTESMGTPTKEVHDVEAGQHHVNPNLTLKKSAEYILSRQAEVAELGNQLLNAIQSLAAGGLNKSAGLTEDDILRQSQQQALDDEKYAEVVVTSVADLVDNAFTAAEVTYAALQKQAEMDEQGGYDDVEVDPNAVEEMNNAEPGVEGEPEISEEEAQALLNESLSEAGVDPSEVGGDEDEGGDEEALQEILAIAEQEGISADEVVAALEELAAEEEAGATPDEMAAVAEDSAKTGSYKFASVIDRPYQLTPEQEKRAGYVKRMLIDIARGPMASGIR